jgi:dipeptidyl aminopeptidase/acylaminoacyl peptidase
LEKYTIERLSTTEFKPSKIEIGEKLEDKEKFMSYTFYFYVEGEKVSGMLNLPKKEGNYPIIVLFRGYANPETYTTGVGTKRAAEYLVQQGFVTLAPDFLGYGESDDPSEDVFEQRFQTYTTGITLLNSIQNVNTALTSVSSTISVQSDKVGIWGHSNGGQIALTVLEITKKSYPTVLWAPVSKPFPYSILYYTDEADDYGKALRKKLSVFEEDYDADQYNLTRYFDRIDAPISLHQGTNDPEVSVEWSNELVDKLKELEKDIDYFTYPGADHNLMPNGWSPAMERANIFYKKYLE